MVLSAGSRFGPYEVLGAIGAGGMGEVYRARDTKLDREVAIKILPEALAKDPERLARFEREARVLASLNHPNIAQIYVVEQGALVMELVEGGTLKGRIPLETALNYARQIAEALEAAHEKGIIHRDLKPANIMITLTGVAKVLDFGLAAVSSGAVSTASDPENSPTLTVAETNAGMIMGTAAYMSPEQAAGKPVDRRADIWSFGVMLWEMLTGRRLFSGETTSHILADVLKGDINLSQVPPETPASIRDLLRRCLDRNEKTRLRDIGEARIAIARYLEDPTERRVPKGPSSERYLSKLAWIVAAAFGLASLLLGYIAYRHVAEEPPHVLQLSVAPPEKGTISTADLPAVSPDGRHIAYVADLDGKQQLWVRDLDSLTARLLVTEDSHFPFWSTDSRAIGFFSGGRLKKIDASGGVALTLCSIDSSGLGGTWNRDDVILFASGSQGVPILRVAASGGNPTAVTGIGSNEINQVFPWFLPDGHHFLYTVRQTDANKTALYVGDLTSKERNRVMLTRSNGIYVSPGFLLFMRERTLMAQPFDARKALTTGDAFPIAEQVSLRVAGTGLFSASQNGVLAYTSGASGQTLTWFDSFGKVIGTVGSAGEVQWPALSPDGKSVAFDRRDGQTGSYDIWLHDFARGTDSRITFDTGNNRFPVWSPDGSNIAFNSDRSGKNGVYRKDISGVGQDEVVDNDGLGKRPTDWSADGHYLFEETASSASKTLGDIWVRPMRPADGPQKPYPYVHTAFNEGLARLSPNGKWLAYRSNETKRSEIYVMTFPNPRGKWQISSNTGSIPAWSRDGQELFFMSLNGKMMAVDIRGKGANPEPGIPRALFDVRLGPDSRFDVSKDGRFLIPAAAEQIAGAPITVIVNWQAKLNK